MARNVLLAESRSASALRHGRGIVAGDAARADGDGKRFRCQQGQSEQQGRRARVVGSQAPDGESDLRGQGDGITGGAPLSQDSGGIKAQLARKIVGGQAAAQQSGGLGDGEGKVVEGVGELVGVGFVQRGDVGV
jgi:hypothetical protein